MQRKIWTQMKDLFLFIQSELLEVHSKFNWESSFNKKFTDTQLLAIKDKVTEMETNFRADIEALTEAIENPVEDGEGDPDSEGGGGDPDPEGGGGDPDPFVAVTGIEDVPDAAVAGTPLTLSGTVAPDTATNKTIVWSVKAAGDTGAAITDGEFTATDAGSATITATIVHGVDEDTDFTADFTITVNPGGGS